MTQLTGDILRARMNPTSATDPHASSMAVSREDDAERLRNRLHEKFPNASTQDVSDAIKIANDVQRVATAEPAQ